jgi:hypothetical protein
MPIIPASELPIEQYHRSAPAWLSKTTLRYFAENGAPWFKLFLDGQIKPPTPGGVEHGLALDCLLTEDAAAFARRFPVLPDDAPRRPDSRQRNAKKPSPETVAAIAWWDAWDAEHPGAIHLSSDDRLILADAAAAVRALPCWSEIEASMAQATVRRHAASLGLGLQSRPDWLRADRGAVRDLKKTRDLSRFGAQAIDLGYHLQAAVAGWCLAGDEIGLEHASLVAVEWERGARAREYVIPHEALVYADRQMREIAAEIADRIARGDWTDRQGQAEPLPVPGWMMAKMEAA